MIVYSTGCPLCKKLLKKLNELNINYELCTDENIMEQKGIDMIPALETDKNEILSFSQAMQYIKEEGC